MMSGDPQTSRSYRRGAIMGLTMAEAFILVSFALLLLLFAFWEREREKEGQITPDVASFMELPVEQREAVQQSIKDGSLEQFLTMKENGADFANMSSILTARERWRFIEEEELRRLLDGASRLSNDAKSDLAGLVEGENFREILGMLGMIEKLVMSGQTPDGLVEQIGVAEKVKKSGFEVMELLHAVELMGSLGLSDRDINELRAQLEAGEMVMESGVGVNELFAAHGMIQALELRDQSVEDVENQLGVAREVEKSGKKLDKLLEAGQMVESLGLFDHSIDDLAERHETARRIEDSKWTVDEVLAAAEALESIEISGHSLETLKNAASTIDSLQDEGRDIREILDILEGITRKIRKAEARQAALAETLKEELGDLVESLGGHIDESGAIILPDGALFERGSARITPLLEGFLNDACRPWLETLRVSDVQFSEVRIEGHASSEWRASSSVEQAYLGNLDLSQRRSRAVLGKCFDIVYGQNIGRWATRHLIAVGYSSVRPIIRNDGEDRVASRRVVLSVAPNFKALLEEIETDVESVSEDR